MTTETNNGRKLLIPLFLLIIAACGRNILFTDSATMPEKTWQLSNIPEFSYKNDDTVSKTNVSFTIRTVPIFHSVIYSCSLPQYLPTANLDRYP